MDRHQIALTERNLPVFAGLNDGLPVPHVDALTTLHGPGMLTGDADGASERIRAAKGSEKLVDCGRSRRTHAVNATERIAIRQYASNFKKRIPVDTSDRAFCNARSMNESHDRLKEARIAAGFAKASDAARRFNWNPITYRAHEKGTRDFTRSTGMTEAYAKAFKVGAAWLAFGTKNARDNRPDAMAIDAAGKVHLLEFKSDVRKEGMEAYRRESPGMNLAAQAAMEAILVDLGIPEDMARDLVKIVVQAAEERPIPGVDRETQARVEAVTRLRGIPKLET